VWRRDGLELFFANPDGRLSSVPVRRVNGTLKFGDARELPVPSIGSGHWGTQYDVSRDGSRVYFLERNNTCAAVEINVILGWRKLLE
jgi:hypothetical protein